MLPILILFLAHASAPEPDPAQYKKLFVFFKPIMPRMISTIFTLK